MIRVARLFMKTPAQGVATPIYLASSPEVEGITGRYFVNRKPKTSSKASYDTTAAARLWQASIDLAGMKGLKRSRRPSGVRRSARPPIRPTACVGAVSLTFRTSRPGFPGD